MNRYEFLSAVLPAEGSGNYVAMFAKLEAKWNVHYNTIQELADGCVAAAGRGLTAYFALGTFRDNLEQGADEKLKVRRLAKLAHEFKTFAIDVDCGNGKPYPDVKAGLRALVEAVKKAQLPAPLIVSSGNGIHAYWPLQTPIDAATWKTSATQLRKVCEQFGLQIDTSKVHDPAMVLRPLDTINFKGGNTVRHLFGEKQYTAQGMLDLLNRLAPSAAKAVPKPIRMSKQQLITETILASTANEYPPFDPDKVVANCAQMAFITKDGGKGIEEPLWHLACGMAKYAANPEETVVKWSEGHETYDYEKTIAKMEAWPVDGPPRCSKFDERRTGVCSKCGQWGRIGSPSRLGAPDPEPIQAPPLAEPIAAPDSTFFIDPEELSPAIEAPAPFKRTTKGIQVLSNGIWLDICSYDIFPSHIVRDPTLGHDLVEWLWNKPHVGYVRIRIRASFIFNDSSVIELNSALADNGFLVESKTKQAWLGAYMRAYAQLLQKHQASVELYDSFGWKDSYRRFVIGSTEFRYGDGVVSSHEVGVSKTIAAKKYDQTFSTAGDIKTWVEWTKILDHPKLALHQIELARAFATPLLALTGLQGVSIGLLGKSGRGKSTMQRWMASVYGIPNKVNTTANDTQMALVQRLGVWGNLPVGIDEATLIKPEILSSLMYWITQGQDRNRVTETLQALSWCTTISLSTNRSLRDKITTTAADAEAIQYRLLEFSFPEVSLFGEDSDWGRRINNMLTDNYGMAGRIYLAKLVEMGPEKLKQEIELRTHYVTRHYGFKFDAIERYWQTFIVLCDLGSYIAHQCGLIKYDFHRGIQAAIDQIAHENRHAISGAKLDAYDMLSDYMSEFNGASITVNYYDQTPPAPSLPLPRGEVRIRKELYRTKGSFKPDRGYAYIDKAHFHKWVVQRGFDFKSVMDTLLLDRAGFVPGRNGRIYMGKDAGVSLPQVNAFGINIAHENFKGMLEQPEYEDDNVIPINKQKGKHDE